jgi:hypothetical protein
VRLVYPPRCAGEAATREIIASPTGTDVVTLRAIDQYVRDLRVTLGELAAGLQGANVDFTNSPKVI